jgi:hypothetical protein
MVDDRGSVKSMSKYWITKINRQSSIANGVRMLEINDPDYFESTINGGD